MPGVTKGIATDWRPRSDVASAVSGGGYPFYIDKGTLGGKNDNSNMMQGTHYSKIENGPVHIRV